MARQMLSMQVQVLVPSPPAYWGDGWWCRYDRCCKPFDHGSPIVVVRMYGGDEFAFCSLKHARYFAGSLLGIAACELWTYRPSGKNGVQVLTILTKRERRARARAHRLKKGPRQHRRRRKQ